ncbi:hypothetical protein [Streptomyces sp. NBC_01477]|uniref:hypothetical protein n=1 Tax=Streptomyces sp. NBC_01477 TaxID=2976015 RepID=UPI002E305D73|nr:hypothetical protein [Streptomyces sp. NBC_01477]
MEFFEGELPDPSTQELPIAGYNHLPRLGLEGRTSELGREQLEVLLRYERGHRDRTPVVRLITARLRGLRERHRRGHPEGGYGRPAA